MAAERRLNLINQLVQEDLSCLGLWSKDKDRVVFIGWSRDEQSVAILLEVPLEGQRAFLVQCVDKLVLLSEVNRPTDT